MQFTAAVTAMVLGFSGAASAAPHVARQFGVRNETAVCGDVTYTAEQVSEAMEAACTHFQEGTDVNDYPHTWVPLNPPSYRPLQVTDLLSSYNNYEGFEFKGLDGPFQEFPMVSDGVYDGGEYIYPLDGLVCS